MSKYNNEYVKGVLKTQRHPLCQRGWPGDYPPRLRRGQLENVEGFMIGSRPCP